MVDTGCWRHATFALDASVSSFVPETAFHEWSSLKRPREPGGRTYTVAPRQGSEAARALIPANLARRSGLGKRNRS
jgi:hypothetical protein